MDFTRNEDAGHPVSTVLESQTTVTACSEIRPKAKIKNENIAESRRIVRNVIIISLVFMALFTNNTANLLSSLLPKAGLGVYVRTASNVTAVLSTLFLPTFFMRRLTEKWTLVLGMLGSIVPIISLFHARFSTMMPAAVFSGFCYPLLWAAKCTYITKVAQKYAALTDKNSDDVITRFFGIFFSFFHISKVWGSIIVSQVLTTEGSNRNTNSTAYVAHCGINFCPADADKSDVLLKPPQSQVNLLLAIYFGLGCFAVAIAALFIDSLDRFVPKESNKEVSIRSQLTALVSTFQEMTNPMLILIIPLTFWSGLQQGFYSADFNQAFITCALGIEAVGYIGICYGICNAAGSYVFSMAVRQFGRVPVFLFAAFVNVGIITEIFNWELDPKSTWVFFGMAGMWGIGDSIWQTQINALYGVIFPKRKEAAFSNYRLWSSLGSIVAFVNVDLLCVQTKMYILFGILAVGMLGFLCIECRLILLRNRKTRNCNVENIT